MRMLELIRLPDIVTVVNALLGFTAILMALEGLTGEAYIVILLAAMADGVDGILARSIEYGELGGDLDSLADLLSFGVAPAIVVYAALHPGFMVPAMIIGAGFSVAGMLRLARYNVYGGGETFRGIPITASGVAVSAFGLSLPGRFSLVVLPIMVVLALLMISYVPYVKPRGKTVLAPLGLLITLTVASFYLGLMWVSTLLARVLCILVIIYLVSPLIVHLYDTR